MERNDDTIVPFGQHFDSVGPLSHPRIRGPFIVETNSELLLKLCRDVPQNSQPRYPTVFFAQIYSEKNISLTTFA
ncbi:hypothetical protein CH273_11405 [Rhodococcus sp. 05-339-2]|nr:hypothetical protein CH273_11405 [Rhodococcus sp. 05-339-2]